MTFYQTEQQEKVHLQQLISIINDTIHNTDTSVKEHVETLQEYKDYIWSNKDIDPHELPPVKSVEMFRSNVSIASAKEKWST